MAYTTTDIYSGKETEYETMLEIMKERRIFTVHEDNGKFVFIEKCDGHFDATLTKEQLVALASELIELSEDREE